MIRKCYRCKYQWTAREIKGIDSQQDYRCRKCGAWTTIKDGKLVAAHIVHGRPGPKKKEIELDDWEEWEDRETRLNDMETSIRRTFHRRHTLYDGSMTWCEYNRKQFWIDVNTKPDCQDLLQRLAKTMAAQIQLDKEWDEVTSHYLGKATEEEVTSALNSIKKKYTLAVLRGVKVTTDSSIISTPLEAKEDGVMYGYEYGNVDSRKEREAKEGACEASEEVEACQVLRQEEASLEKISAPGSEQIPGGAVEPQSPVPCHGRRKGTHHGKGKTEAHSESEEKAGEGGIPGGAHKRHRRLGRSDSGGPGPGKAVPKSKKEGRKEMVPVRHMTLKQLEEEEP